MMHDALPVALVLLASAVVVVVLFRSLAIPAILGYLLVGAVIGPHAMGLVPETESQRYLAEFGVVFLMFSVGLEFSLPQLMGMRRLVLGFGGAQVAVVMAIGVVASIAIGLTWREGLIAGGVVAMSSTAIISKELAERMQLHSEYGRGVMGVLLFQDLAVIPLLVLIPALWLSEQQIAHAIAIALVKAAVILAHRALPRADASCARSSTWWRGASRPSSSCSSCCWWPWASHGSRSRRGCRSHSAHSSPECSSPRPSTATRSRTTSSRSATCCWDFSS